MSVTNIVHVSFRVSGDLRKPILDGHVDMTFDAITTMAANVQAGKVRALGTSAATRSRALPGCLRSPKLACLASKQSSGSALSRRLARCLCRSRHDRSSEETAAARGFSARSILRNRGGANAPSTEAEPPEPFNHSPS
jgi:hypothetical protein